MAYILHIDTSSNTGIAMLAKEGVPVSSRLNENSREHAAVINEMVDEVLMEAGITLKDIDAIAVCNGPGSYTGLRIGLATAKGYCYAVGKSLILHNRLQLMLEEAKAKQPLGGSYLALIPARNGEYYGAAEGGVGGIAPRHILTEEVNMYLAEAVGTVVIIGEVAADLAEQQRVLDSLLIEHKVLDISIWSTVTLHAYRDREFADLAYSEPEYLKAAFVTSKKA